MKYKYREKCKECGFVAKSNWRVGPTSTQQKVLRHRMEKHGYAPTDKEKEILGGAI